MEEDRLVVVHVVEVVVEDDLLKLKLFVVFSFLFSSFLFLMSMIDVAGLQVVGELVDHVVRICC